MDLMWSLILVLCRSLLDDGLLQLSYFCGGILSNIMLEWSDDRKLQSYSKQYLLDKLVDISCLTLGHDCKLTIVGFEYSSVTNSSLGWHFFIVFCFSKYEAKLSKFYIDSYFENQKIIPSVPCTSKSGCHFCKSEEILYILLWYKHF